MNINDAENLIASKLEESLASRGFVKVNRFLLTRQYGQAFAQIKCGVRKDHVSGWLMVSLIAGLRFPEVEAVLGRTDDDQSRSTIALPIHLLHENRQLAEWDVEAPDISMTLTGEIERYAIPFFERFKYLENVLVSLRSENPVDWFALTPETRVEKLAAILALRGETSAALSLLEKEIELRRNKPVGHRLRFQKLRDTLESTS